jgi:arabinose-5-phosphate isomerase
MLERTNEVEMIRARDIMTINPKTIGPDELAVDALDKLRKYGITQLVVTDSNKYMGIVHLHDLLKEGLI